MAGHNKWSQIKRKKAANDASRGKIISKHIRAIQSAVRESGSADTTTNLALKNALSAAKSDNVPADNIDRAIERALGGTEGGNYEAVTYEGYGPAGIALLVEGLTDNRNRTIAEVRHVFSKGGGNLDGGTAWQFDAKGVIVLKDKSEAAQEAAIELGAEDLEIDEEGLTIYTDPTELHTVTEGLETAGFESDISQLSKVPQVETALSEEDALKVARFIEQLEDLDDVQNVYTNADLGALDAVGEA